MDFESLRDNYWENTDRYSEMTRCEDEYDRSDVKKFVDEWFEKAPREAYAQGIEYVLEKIDEAPTVDAQEVKHGRWEHTDDGAARCTSCKIRT